MTERYRRNIEIDDEIDFESIIDENDVESSLEHEEEMGILHHAIDSLREDRRQVIVLSYFDGYDTITVAKLLEETPYRVSKLRGEAISVLRNKLKGKLRPELLS